MHETKNIFKTGIKDILCFIVLLFVLLIEMLFAAYFGFILHRYEVFGKGKIAANISFDVSCLTVIFLSILLILLIKKLHRENSILIFMIFTAFMWIGMSVVFKEVDYSYGGAISNISPMYSLMMMYVTQDMILMKNEPIRHKIRIMWVIGFTLVCTILHFILHHIAVM